MIDKTMLEGVDCEVAQVLMEALDAARMSNRDYIQTDDILVGLLKTPCAASEALSRMRISPSKVRAAGLQVTGVRREPEKPDKIRLSRRAQQALSLAKVSADGEVTSLDLLRATLRDEGGIAERALKLLEWEPHKILAALPA